MGQNLEGKWLERPYSDHYLLLWRSYGGIPPQDNALSAAAEEARRCTRSSRPRRLRRVSGVRGLARRGGVGCGFPRLGFPPGAPLSEAPLSSADHRPGGKPIPVRSLALPRWGQPHGGHFRLWCRRPSGPPAEISPPLTEHPRPPAVLRGPVARPPAVRVPHGSRASTVATTNINFSLAFAKATSGA